MNDQGVKIIDWLAQETIVAIYVCNSNYIMKISNFESFNGKRIRIIRQTHNNDSTMQF